MDEGGIRSRQEHGGAFKHIGGCSPKRRNAAWAKGCRADAFPPKISALTRTEAPVRGPLWRGHKSNACSVASGFLNSPKNIGLLVDIIVSI